MFILGKWSRNALTFPTWVMGFLMVLMSKIGEVWRNTKLGWEDEQFQARLRMCWVWDDEPAVHPDACVQRGRLWAGSRDGGQAGLWLSHLRKSSKPWKHKSTQGGERKETSRLMKKPQETPVISEMGKKGIEGETQRSSVMETVSESSDSLYAGIHLLWNNVCSSGNFIRSW